MSLLCSPALRVEDLTVSYEDRGLRPVVLDRVSFSVDAGEVYGMVGESGCGKSTVAYALARHLATNGRVEGGRIELDGIDVGRLEGEALRRWRSTSFAMVHQEPGAALNPTTRIGDQVAEVFGLAGATRGHARRRAIDLLDQVRLPQPAAIARRYPHELSGGQQQRVVIAIALAVRQRLLVLDEPTTGLDTTVEADVLDLIDALRHELSAAVVFITHNLGLVARLCDRVGVLYAGKVVEEGRVRDVLGEPVHPYTKGLLRCVPRLGATKECDPVVPIAGAPPAPGAWGERCAFAERCAGTDHACRTEHPPRLAQGDGHRALCHHAGADALAGNVVIASGPARPPRIGLLELRQLSKRYGEVTACDSVDLQVGYGEVVGLVGESGSGKTTLGRMILGLTAPSSGAVVFEGDALAPSVTRRRRAVRRRMQMVFQSPDATLNPRHRVRAILGRSIGRLGGRGTVEELAARVRLEPRLLDSLAARLSGGQKQRVAIGRAFAGDAALVVCDEPVSALDVSVQASVLALLADLQRTGGTSYVLISHDLAVVRYLSDRIAVMYAGQIVEEGPSEAVFHPPHHPYTEALLAAIPTVDAFGCARPRFGPAAAIETQGRSGGKGCRFAPRCPRAISGTCEVIAPPWLDLGPGHRVRCHLDASTLGGDQLGVRVPLARR